MSDLPGKLEYSTLSAAAPRDAEPVYLGVSLTNWLRTLIIAVLFVATFRFLSGEINWRRGWDSNPRNGFPLTAFPVLPIQPLLHLSRGLLIADCRLTIARAPS